MITEWLTTSWTEVWLVGVSSVAMILALIAWVRFFGLRSLSKMSSFDFVVTVALGSVVATVVASSTSLANGVLAAGALLGVQATIAVLRVRLGLDDVVDNQPMILMRDGRFHHVALRRSRVTESDVIAKLREANVTDFDQVLAVVLESTGDVSVLHGDGPLDERLLDGVRTADDDG